MRNNGLALTYVPEEYRYDGIYREALATYGKAIGFIPESHITPELCSCAVAQNPAALEYIPESFLNYQLCATAVSAMGKMLAHVPSNQIDRAICLSAVTNDGMAIEHVPDAFFDKEIQLAAVGENGLALQCIPARKRSRVVCEKAVESNPLALEFVPIRFASESIVLGALEANGEALRYVANPTTEMCRLAVHNTEKALRFVPEEMKSAELCYSAFERDWHVITYIPAQLISADMLQCAVLEESNEISSRSWVRRRMNLDFYDQLSDELLTDRAIAIAQRESGMRRVVGASWDAREMRFHVDEELFERKPASGIGLEEPARAIRASLGSFEDLSSYLGGNLSQVDFGGFDFSAVPSIPDYVDRDTIPSSASIQLGVYEQDAYRKLIAEDRLFANDRASQDSDEDCLSLANADSPLDRYYLANERPTYYVSDIHLNHKLIKKFPEHASENEITAFIKGFVESMVDTVPKPNRCFPLLILGDVSYNFDVAEEFYARLDEEWRGPVICVLGNHELWNSNPAPEAAGPIDSVESIVEKYRKMLGRHNAILLENELFVRYRNREYKTISHDELLKMTDDELQDALRHCSTIIAGGLGFTALSSEYTAEKGLYRNTIRTLDKDAVYTERFRSFYERIADLVPDKPVIVATHTPMQCWSHAQRQAEWIYLNGHTHRNSCELTDTYSVYEDNQVGYHVLSAGLKRFLTHPAFDVFKYHDDGIHVVSRTDYIDFCRECGIGIGSFTRRGDVIMLKRDGLYCFILKMEANGKYYLLAGGRINTLSVQDPNYYYERMKLYADRTKAAFSAYNKAIKTIAREVKRIGGAGTVHGCIVDIDFLNHIYLDPFSGELRFYYAESINNRIEYPSFDQLLEARAPYLLPAYRRLIKPAIDGSKGLAFVGSGAVAPFAQAPSWSSDTSMYRPSNVVRSVQYLLDNNVIRNWNDAVLEGVTDEDIAASNSAPKRLYAAGDHSLNSGSC